MQSRDIFFIRMNYAMPVMGETDLTEPPGRSREATPGRSNLRQEALPTCILWPLLPPAPAVVAAPRPSKAAGQGWRTQVPSLHAEERIQRVAQGAAAVLARRRDGFAAEQRFVACSTTAQRSDAEVGDHLGPIWAGGRGGCA